jgi:hypothetical protein
MIWWHGNVVTVGVISVDIPEYKMFLPKKLEEAEKFVEEHVFRSSMTYPMTKMSSAMGYS